MTARWPAPAGLHAASAGLPVEGRLPSFDGATGWLNSPPLTPDQLRGKVVLVNFWTYTCINWLRQLPYVRAWAEKYAGEGLGRRARRAHARVRVRARRRTTSAARSRTCGSSYPVAIDNDYEVWDAFDNHYWPALYFVDAQGRIRHHHFGEGEYQQSEMVLQQLLTEAGSGRRGRTLVSRAPSIRGRRPTGKPENTGELHRLRAHLGFASSGGLDPAARTSTVRSRAVALESLGAGRGVDRGAQAIRPAAATAGSPIGSRRAT